MKNDNRMMSIEKGTCCCAVCLRQADGRRFGFGFDADRAEGVQNVLHAVARARIVRGFHVVEKRTLARTVIAHTAARAAPPRDESAPVAGLKVEHEVETLLANVPHQLPVTPPTRPAAFTPCLFEHHHLIQCRMTFHNFRCRCLIREHRQITFRKSPPQRL